MKRFVNVLKKIIIKVIKGANFLKKKVAGKKERWREIFTGGKAGTGIDK